MRAVQYFSDEYLAQCRDATPEQILEFLEAFRLMYSPHPEHLPEGEGIAATFRKGTQPSV